MLASRGFALVCVALTGCASMQGEWSPLAERELVTSVTLEQPAAQAAACIARELERATYPRGARPNVLSEQHDGSVRITQWFLSARWQQRMVFETSALTPQRAQARAYVMHPYAGYERVALAALNHCAAASPAS